MSGRISFIGAGPGAADLITVRAARRIAEADVVVWSASVLAPETDREARFAAPDTPRVPDKLVLPADSAAGVVEPETFKVPLADTFVADSAARVADPETPRVPLAVICVALTA